MAAASKYVSCGIPINIVMKLGDWASLAVFNTFYNRAKVRSNIVTTLDQVDLMDGQFD